MRKGVSKRFSSGISLTLSFLTIFIFFTACKEGKGSSASGNSLAPVITGVLTNCNADSVFIYEVYGTEAEKIASAANSKESGFVLQPTLPRRGFYYLGTDPQNAAQLILGTDATLEFKADCSNFQNSAAVTGSEVNDQFKVFTNRIRTQNQQMNQLAQNIRNFQRANPAAVPQLQQQMKQVHASQATYLDSIKTAGGFLAKVAASMYYPPYGSDPSHSTQYPSELDYFANNFIASIDFSDPEVQYLPQVYDRVSNFTAALLGNRIPAENVEQVLMEKINMVPAGSNAQRILYVAGITGAEQAKNDQLYSTLGTAFVKAFSGKSPMAATIANNIEARKAFIIGGSPPNIDLPTPEGKNLALNSFKGKVVLVDFWASWCRPCRAENPNVVKMYNKYHSKGFDIYSVSLDKKKEPWVAAIAQDGMIWSHVSDLAGWKSIAAAAYNVSSIPATFLLDKEGKLIGKGLRGQALEQKMEELFGF